MKKFFKFIFIFGLTAFITLLFIKPTVAEAYSFNEDVKEQLNLNNDNNSLISTQATINPLFPSSVKIIGKDKSGEAGTVIYTPDAITEPVTPPSMPVPTNDYYIFNDVPYKVRAYILEVEFANRDLISSVEATYNGKKITTQDIFEDGSVELIFRDESVVLEDKIDLVIKPKTGSQAFCFINVNRLAPNENNNLGKISIVAHDGEESVEICNSTTEVLSNSGRLNITYPNGASQLPFHFKDFTIEATPESDLSTVEIKINNIVQSSYTFDSKTTDAQSVSVSIKVQPEAGYTRTYQATITKATPDKNQEFEITDASYTYLDPDGNEKTGSFDLKVVTVLDSEGKVSSVFISNPESLLPYTATSASFKVTPASTTTKVYIDGKDFTSKVFTTPIENSKSSLTKRLLLLIKSEYDEMVRPGNTTSGGLSYNIDISSSKPDAIRKLTDIQILHAISGNIESNDENTVSSEFAYSFELKKSILGEVFKLNLTWESGYTKAYLSPTNSSSIMTEENLYNPQTVWSIGTDLYLYLQSQDGEYFVYAISTSFADERSTENGIEDVVLRYASTNINFTFDEAQQNYPLTGSFKVPYSVTSILAEITLKHEMETLKSGEGYITGTINSDLKVIQNISLEDGVNVLKLQAVSEKEEEGKEYTFVIEREDGQTENTIDDLVINSIDCKDTSQIGIHFDTVFNSEDTSFSFYVARNINAFSLNFTAPSQASYVVSSEEGSSTTLPYSFTATNGEVTIVTILVKSEIENITGIGEGTTYTIKIYAADMENQLDDLHIYLDEEGLIPLVDVDGDAFSFSGSANLGSILVPFTTKKIYFVPEKEDFLGIVKFGNSALYSMANGNVKELNVGLNTISIEVLSELGALSVDDDHIASKSTTYTLDIIRVEGAHNADLDSLTIEIDGVEKTFTDNGVDIIFNSKVLGPYPIEYVLENAEKIHITAVPKDAKATLEGDGTHEIHLSYDTITQTFTLLVTAEDEVTTKEYVVQLWTTRAEPDDDNDILSINATIDGNRYDSWNTTSQKTHQLKLLVNEQGARLLFVRGTENSKLYVEIDGEAQEIENNGNQNIYVISLNTGEEKTYKFYCVAEDHTKGDDYTLTISRAADDDASLATLTYNGTVVPGFTAGMGSDEFEVLIGDLDEVTITATPTKSTTTLSTLANPYSLNPGDNKIIVTTTAQDGTTKFTYVINVIKDAEKILDDIEAIVIEEGQEVNLLTPEFASLTYTGYSVKLNYELDSLLIRYTTELNTALLILPDNTTIEGENKSFTIENIEVGTHLYKIRVRTASGSAADYEISITRNEPDTDATLKELTYNGIAVPGFTAGMESDEFEIFIKEEEEVYFTAVPTKITTTVNNLYDSSNPISLSIGENSFTITTLAQDGETSCTYVVKVIKDAPRTLDSLEAIVDTENKVTDFDSETYHYEIELEYSQTSVTIVYSTSYADYNTICFIDALGQEVDNDTTTLAIEDIEVGSWTYKIRITGYSGESNEYEVVITRDSGSDENTILSFKYLANHEDIELTELNINATDTDYFYVVGRDISIFNPTIVLSDSKASYEMLSDTTLIPGQANVKEIKVTSENGKEKIYTFTVYPCDTDFEMELISLLTASDGTNVLGVDGVSYIDFSNNVFTLTVLNAVESAYLNVLGGGINSVIYVNGSSFTPSMITLEEGQNTFDIYIKSEYGVVNSLATDAQSQTYTLTIERVVDPTIIIKTTGKNDGPTTDEEVVPYGTNKTIYIAENGYTILSVKVDGVAKEIVDSFELSNITSDHVIEIEYEAITYTITALVTAGQGSIYIGEEKVESEITYSYGQSFTFRFVPAEGYKLSKVVVNGVTFPGTPATVNIGEQEDQLLQVEFEILKFKIELNVIGEGQITPALTEISYGANQRYDFVADIGYQIKNVIIDGTSRGQIPFHRFTNVKETHTLSVEFETVKYTISLVGRLENGTVLPGDDIEYEQGDSVVYTFTPNMGYHVESLLIDGIALEGDDFENALLNGYSFTDISSSHTLEINFAINTYTITVTQAENGHISDAKDFYEYGEDATFTFTPMEGCHIVHLLIDGVVTEASETYTFQNIVQNHTISAVFKGETSSYKVYHHFQKLDGVSYDEPVLVLEEEAEVNDTIQYLVPPVPGFDAQPVGALTVQPGNVSEIHVYFDRLSYSVSLADETGTSSVEGLGTYLFGAEVTLSVELERGYRWIKYISSNETLLASSENNPYSFTMPAGNIVFTLDLIAYYFIEIQPTQFGTMSIEPGTYEFNASDNLTIEYSPYEGYKIKSIIIDGNSLSTYDEASYTFSNIRANHTFCIEFEQIMYSMTTSIISNGSTSFNEVLMVPYGSRHVFTITLQEGYELINVIIDGEELGPYIEEYEFEEIYEDHEIEIQIQQIICQIRVSVIGNGTVNPSGDAYVVYGSDRVLSFIPDTGYYVKNVKIDNRDQGALDNYLFDYVVNDHQVEVEFEQLTYTIEIIHSEHGSILPGEDLTLPYGSNQTISFIPDTGYAIKDVKVNNTSVGTPTNYTFLNIQADQIVEVEFEQIYFTIDVYTAGQGRISPDGEVSVPFGEDQTFEILPNEGYYISRLEVDGKVIEAVGKYTFEDVTDDHMISVEFAQITYTIEVDVIGEGAVNLDSVNTAIYGENKIVQFTPDYGHRIKSILINGEESQIVSTFTLSDIKENYIIVVEFEQIEFTISIQSTGNGTVNPDHNYTVRFGSNELIGFVPDAGYTVSEVLIDGESVGTPLSYLFENITEDHTVEVEFVEFLHTITVLCGENGTASLERETIVQHNSNITCRFTPNEGFIIEDILVDGISAGDISAYYLSDITSDHIIEAYFTEIVFNVTVYFGPNGTVTYPTSTGDVVPTDKISVFSGQDFSLDITPNNTYKANIWINGEKVDTTDKIILEAIQMDYNIQVDFVQMLNLEITFEGKGSVPESSAYEWMTQVTLVFTPDPGYKVKSVFIDGNSVGSVENYTFPTLVMNHSVHVIFEPILYSVHSTIYGEGEVTGNKDINQLVYLDSCVITITPEDGWEIGIVFVDGERVDVVDNQVTLKNIDDNVEVVVYFSEIPVRSIPLWIFIILGIIILILIVLLILVSIFNKKRRDRYRY